MMLTIRGKSMLIIPWKESVDTSTQLNFLIVIFLILLTFIAIESNFDLVKKPRHILYWASICANIIIGIGMVICFYWYIALPMNFLFAKIIFKQMTEDTVEYSRFERQGATSLLKLKREVQRKEFMLKSKEEQEAHLTWCDKNPIIINKTRYFVLSLLPPILYIIVVLVMRVGYLLW